MSLLLLILGLVLFIGLVVIHEWGHFIMARRNGVKVEEFGIFFPPRLFKYRTKGGWDFTINLIPLGGFVRMKGEHDSDTAKGSFGAASLLAKSKIMAAGVVMNYITAVLLLTLLALIGMPQLVENQFTIASDTKTSRSDLFVSYVEPNSPASKLGLKAGDRIVAALQQDDNKAAGMCADVDPYMAPNVLDAATKGELTPCGQLSPAATKLSSSQDLMKYTKGHAGERVAFAITRDGEQSVNSTTLRSESTVAASRKTDNPKGYLGIAPATYQLNRSTWSAPVVAVGMTGQFTALTFQGLGHALSGVGSIIAGTATGNSEARQHGQTAASEQVSGPVGIFKLLQSGSSIGIEFVLFIIAVISLTLAIMNILPIPALDGGRLWLTLFTRGIGKPISPRREELINGFGFVFLISLMILITYVDLNR